MEKDEILKRANEYIRQEKDERFRTQVIELLEKENLDELNDRFYTDLVFGTGGLRGIIGGGYNRMNSFTVQRATQGLANYVKKQVKTGEGSVVIAYDSRNFSDQFALDAARVFAGNGMKAYLFSSLRPTPELSFAVRYLGTTCGIVITASHNPPEYNGYKAYWNDGAQVLAPHDKGIIAEVKEVKEVLILEKKEALDKGLLQIIDKEVDEPYMAMVKSLSLRPELVKEKGKELKVVYTPLHGTGACPVEKVLTGMGIEVVFVEEQKEPDGNFPTVAFPNPEEASAMKLALELGKKVKADLVMGTDPDSDRIGIAVPEGEDYILVTGNQLGVLLADYFLSTKKELGILPPNSGFVKTIVTTELQRLVAESYGVACYDTYTGFKHIAGKIREWETLEDGPVYQLGGEESYGYLIGTAVRDKDAISAVTMTAEMALYHLSRGKSVLDRLKEIYKTHGYFEETLIARYFKGESGIKVMKSLMNMLREDPPRTFAGQAVAFIKDYLESVTLDVAAGRKVKNIELPPDNVLQFILEDGTVVSARPSGTEPKIKFYASSCSEPGMELAEARKVVGKKIQAIEDQIGEFVSRVM